MRPSAASRRPGAEGVTVADLITLIVGVVLAAEHRAVPPPRPSGCSG
jgi:hypothetical protein